MCLRGFQRHRRFTGSLALAGMAFYAVLLPWHTVSQVASEIAPTALAGLSEPPCHQNAAEAPGQDTKAPEPSKPRTHCPICNGFAALQLAVADTAIAMLALPELGSTHFAGTDDHLADAWVHAPQIRGPPSLPA